MPVIYSIDVPLNLIRTRCVGSVKLQDVLHHFKALERDPKIPKYLDVLLDLTENETLPDAGQVAAVADAVAAMRLRIQFGACAVVAPTDALFGMMRMFEAMAEGSFRITRTFRSIAEAETWLATHQPVAKPASPEGVPPEGGRRQA